MAVTSGKPKEKITITIGHTNILNINKAIANGEFSSVSEVIDKGVSFFFENRNKQSEDAQKVALIEWLESQEGEDRIKNIMRKVKDE